MGKDDILEEFQSCFTCTAFLQLTNTFPPDLEIKGGWVPNAAKAIIITSNTAPDDQILMLNNNTQIHGLLTEKELQMNMIQDANLWQELNALVPISKPSLNNTPCLNRKYIELISQLEIV